MNLNITYAALAKAVDGKFSGADSAAVATGAQAERRVGFIAYRRHRAGPRQTTGGRVGIFGAAGRDSRCISGRVSGLMLAGADIWLHWERE